MNNDPGPASSGLFLVARKKVPPLPPAAAPSRLRAIAERALIPLAVVSLAAGVLASFDKNSWIQAKSLLAPALPSITAFLGAAAGASFRCRRSR